MRFEYLNLIEEKLKQLKSKNRKKIDYYIPERWISNGNNIVKVEPYEYFLEQIRKVKNLEPVKLNYKDWSSNSIVYNLFVRLFSSFKHFPESTNLSEIINGFRQTGTFLKTISLIPYLYKLNINTIYLLPVTKIGIDKRKGNLGSPYAIRNHYKLEESLSEPFLELSSEIEFKAFSEILKKLNIKLVCEFVLRTASVDSDLALEKPEWFYWINSKIKERTDPKNENQYGPPIFTKEQLREIKEKVEKGDFINLIPPSETYRKMFSSIPTKVARVENKIYGLLNNGKKEVVIPSAFADWPPDDNQPLWSDVTYLRLYDHKDFNYIAYNTIRMYDKRLAKEKNQVNDLWEYLANVIPHYIKNYNIDGVMLDMGHALPSELRKKIVENAFKEKPDFVFWEENFSLDQKSKEEGYSAVVGYMPFDFNIGWKVKEIIRKFQKKEIPIDFFATPENHNTRRAASRDGYIDFVKTTFVISCFLPTITFIHNGIELFEKEPVNTGLGFSTEEIKNFPSEKLALFSANELNWLNNQDMISFISQVIELKRKYIKEENQLNENDIELIETNNDDLIIFKRKCKVSGNEIIITANLGDKIINYEIDSNIIKIAECLITNEKFFEINSKINININPYKSYISLNIK